MDSLNEIRLTPAMLVALYGQSLVAASDHTSVKKAGAPVEMKHEAPAAQVKFLGGNEKNILVIVNSPGHTYLGEKELSFLTKMLEACRLNIGDVAIVNQATAGFDDEVVKTQLQPSRVLTFGINPGLPAFTVLNENGIPVIDAVSLSDMTGETPEARALKTKLWVALKQMFGL